MRDAVRTAFVDFTSKFEGVVPFFYNDIKGYVTIAVGDLVDPIGMAIGLPMVRPDGSPASPAQIAIAWRAVKARQDLNMAGGGHFARVLTEAGLEELRLTKDGITTVVMGKLDQMNAQLAKRFKGFEDACCDAQLALLSMSWASGPMFSAPMFAGAFNAQDWADYVVDDHGVRSLVGGCAFHCHFDDSHNPGLRPRNSANRKLFEIAQIVKDQGLDPSVLYYPNMPTALPTLAQAQESAPANDDGGPDAA